MSFPGPAKAGNTDAMATLKAGEESEKKDSYIMLYKAR